MMSLKSLESMIAREARGVLKNPKLRVKDLTKWSSLPIKKANDEEIVEHLPVSNTYIAVKADCDKRKHKSA